MYLKNKIQEKIREFFKINYSLKEDSIHPLEVPRNPFYGDYALPLFNLSKELKKEVTEIGENLKKELLEHLGNEIEEINLIRGFLNIKVSHFSLLENLKNIYKMKENYGKTDIGKGKKVLIEFVSANPTGPLNVVNARAACIGDTLTNLFKNAGFIVEKEYYVNDSGAQIELLSASLKARIKELKGEKVDFPENGYPGKYLIDIAKEIIDKNITNEREFVIKRIVDMQKNSLERYGVFFDRFFYESKIRESNKLKEVLEKIKKYTYKKDGALFFRTTELKDTQDRVLIKKDKEPTYFLVDLAYHLDKIQRKYDIIINIWGPDHHGYIRRMKSGIIALGFPEENFEILISQQVHLVEKGEKVKMSKRKGVFYLLDELIDEVGKDAARFFMLLRNIESPLEFDLSLAKKIGEENPVYYLQYMHARTFNVSLFAGQKGITERIENLEKLNNKKEKELMRSLLFFPDILQNSLSLRATHLLPHFLLELARAYHSFYQSERIVSLDKELSSARLLLNNACALVIKRGLEIMGISQPERME